MLLLPRCLALVVCNDDVVIEGLVHNGLDALPAIESALVLVVAISCVAHDNDRVVESTGTVASAYPLARYRRRPLAIRHYDDGLVQIVGAFLGCTTFVTIDSCKLCDVIGIVLGVVVFASVPDHIKRLTKVHLHPTPVLL